MTDYLAIARECGAHDTQPFGTTDKTLRRVSMLESELSAFAERVRQDERERCAALCRENVVEMAVRGSARQLAPYCVETQSRHDGQVYAAAILAQQVPERAE
jgi:hypothetical protein